MGTLHLYNLLNSHWIMGNDISYIKNIALDLFPDWVIEKWDYDSFIAYLPKEGQPKRDKHGILFQLRDEIHRSDKGAFPLPDVPNLPSGRLLVSRIRNDFEDLWETTVQDAYVPVILAPSNHGQRDIVSLSDYSFYKFHIRYYVDWRCYRTLRVLFWGEEPEVEKALLERLAKSNKFRFSVRRHDGKVLYDVQRYAPSAFNRRLPLEKRLPLENIVRKLLDLSKKSLQAPDSIS